jgi:hypothetical protein
MLHIFIGLSLLLLNWFFVGNPIQPIRGLSLVPATTPPDSAKSQPADLDSSDLVEEGMDQLELQHIVGRQP